jgi:hypothetical protein
MRRTVLALTIALPLAAAAQAPPLDAPPKPEWQTAVYVDGYFQSGERTYFVPTVFLDRGALHIEPRYNYEDFDTGSLFAGWAFTFGDEGRYAKLTPMLGAVFGRLNGVAPGLEVEARWGRVAFWLEGEYVFDLKDSSANYLYTWSELNVYALDWLWLGASVERMKVVQTTTEVSVGPMVGVGKPGRWSVSGYAYGLTEPAPLLLVTGTWTF